MSLHHTGTQNTTAPKKTEKKPHPCKQWQPQWCTNYSQALESVYSVMQSLPSSFWDSQEIRWKQFSWGTSLWDKSEMWRESEKVLWKKATVCANWKNKGQMKREAGWVVFKRDEVCSDNVLSYRPTVTWANWPQSLWSIFLQGKKNK